jgi:hypothetical protein
MLEFNFVYKLNKCGHAEQRRVMNLFRSTSPEKLWTNKFLITVWETFYINSRKRIYLLQLSVNDISCFLQTG